MQNLASVLLAALLLSPVSSIADEDQISGEIMVSFLTEMEDRWDGEGVRRELMNQGVWKEQAFDLDLDVDDGWKDQSWEWDYKIRLESGITEYGVTRLEVREDYLFVENVSTWEPVRVEIAEPTRLRYSFRRYDAYWGRVYDITYEMFIDEQGLLNGMGQVDWNGVMIAEEVFTAKN